MKDLEFQKKQVEKLRSGRNPDYEEASIYTILMDLCEGNGVDEVFMVLHNLATDLDERDELESMFDKAMKYIWDK